MEAEAAIEAEKSKTPEQLAQEAQEVKEAEEA